MKRLFVYRSGRLRVLDIPQDNFVYRIPDDRYYKRGPNAWSFDPKHVYDPWVQHNYGIQFEMVKLRKLWVPDWMHDLRRVLTATFIGLEVYQQLEILKMMAELHGKHLETVFYMEE